MDGRTVGFEEILKLLDPILPKPLQLPVALGIVVLLTLATLLDLYQDFGLWEAAWSPIWMGAAGCWSAGLIVVVVLRWRSLRTPRAIFWGALFCGLTVAAALQAKASNAYLYNEIGFQQSREWTPAAKQPPDPTRHGWDWHIDAVKDLSQTPVLIELKPSDRCQFESFWPTADGSEYRPEIIDESEEAVHLTRWRIQSLRKPAHITFHLQTQAQGVPTCRPLISVGK